MPGSHAHLSTARRPPPAPAPAPWQAIIADAAAGLPRTGGQDHVSAAEFARGQPDQVAALQVFTTWGWVDAATRTWAGASEVMVLTQRPEDAGRAFDFWTSQAVQSGLAASSCAGGAPVLDRCSQAASPSRSVVVGQKGAIVFRLDCPPADAGRLTDAQADALAS